MEDRIIKLISDHLGIEPENIKLSSSLIDDLDADSLDSVELIMLIEDEFEVIIEDDEADSIVTVQDIVNIMAKKVS